MTSCSKELGPLPKPKRPLQITTRTLKEPDFKFCAVKVSKYKKPKERIVIIGAGAGAFGFVKSYREVNINIEKEKIILLYLNPIS